MSIHLDIAIIDLKGRQAVIANSILMETEFARIVRPVTNATAQDISDAKKEQFPLETQINVLAVLETQLLMQTRQPVLHALRDIQVTMLSAFHALLDLFVPLGLPFLA